MSQWQSQTRKMNRHYQSVSRGLNLTWDNGLCISAMLINGQIATLPYSVYEPNTEYLQSGNNYIGSVPFNFMVTPAKGGIYPYVDSSGNVTGKHYIGISEPERVTLQYKPVELSSASGNVEYTKLEIKNGYPYLTDETVTLEHSTNEVRTALIPIYDKYNWLYTFYWDDESLSDPSTLPTWFTDWEEQQSIKTTPAPRAAYATLDDEGKLLSSNYNNSSMNAIVQNIAHLVLDDPGKPKLPKGDLLYTNVKTSPIINAIIGADNRERTSPTDISSDLENLVLTAYNTQITGTSSLITPRICILGGVTRGYSMLYHNTDSSTTQSFSVSNASGTWNSSPSIWFNGVDYKGTYGGTVGNYLRSASVIRYANDKSPNILAGTFRVLREVKAVPNVQMTTSV